MAKRPLVDDRCFDCAEAMLDDLRVTILRKPTEDEVWWLAGAIQQLCEDHFLDIEDKERDRASNGLAKPQGE